jgi:hypothetical protein
MGGTMSNPIKELGKALGKLAEHLKNEPFLSFILALAIVLAIVAIAQKNIYVTITVAAAAVLSFFLYLYHIRRKSSGELGSVLLEIAAQISLAVTHEGYIPEKKKREDFAGAMAGYIRKSRVKPSARRAVDSMAAKFEDNFNVPSYNE